MDVSAEYRGVAIFTMIMIYQNIGEYEKAKVLASEQNSIVLCKEVLLPKASAGEEKDKYQGENIIARTLYCNFRFCSYKDFNTDNEVWKKYFISSYKFI